VITIDTLPDEALLEIFDLFVDEDALEKKDIEAWQSLVHVCQRWRSIIFGSPRRLNLRLACSPGTPVRDKLDIWPPLPLVIRGSMWPTDPDGDNLITIFERRDRVCQISLYDVELPLGQVMAEMQEPFSELTDLSLGSFFPMETVLPDSFLGGSAPRLRKVHLYGIPFPGLPKLLLSATHLVKIQLLDIPRSGYFSPEALVTALDTLTSLKLLVLKFLFQSSPNLASRRPLPTRSLPVLNTLKFEGVGEYLDDFVSRIDAPRLNDLEILFSEKSVDTPQFTQFIHRTPILQALEKAYVAFQPEGAGVKLSSQTPSCGELKVKILCKHLNQQVSTLKRFCTSYLPLSTPEDVYIYGNIDLQADWDGVVENIQWLELLQLFTSVNRLYFSEDIVPLIGPALRELVGGSTTEVLPIVQNIFLEKIQPRGPGLDGVEEFIAARRLSGRPIAVSTIPLRERNLMRWASEFYT
jgi:F-box-like